MVTISSEYLAAIRAMGRADRLMGTLTLDDGTQIPLSDANVEDGSVSISWECVSGEEIELGSATMAQLDMAIRTELSRYVFYGAKIVLFYGVLLPGGTWYDVPLGAFTVAEAERKSTLVEMTAYDNLLAMDKDYGGKALYGTPFEIFVAICEECGLDLATTEEEFLAMPNGAEKIQVDETSGCKTWRDCAKVVAQMLGVFVVADRSGAVALRRYGKEKAVTIPRKNRFTTKMADYICSYMGLRVVSSSGEYRAYDADQEEGLELTIQDAPAWDYGMEETLQARVDALLQEVIQIIYTPGDVTMTGDPALECGDLVELQTEDGVVTTLITSMTWKYRGRMTVKSAGVNPYLKSQVTRKTVILRELQTQNTENKLIFYSFTNQNDVTAKAGGDEQQVAQVTCATTKATSAMFIAQLPVEVECEDTEEIQTTTNETETTYTVQAMDSGGASTTITDAEGNPVTLSVTVKNTDTDTVKTVTQGYVDLQVEYYIDGNLVDYELVHRCRAGRHILALLYIFDSLDGNCSFLWQVRVKVVGGSGTVTVPKRGFRATITGQGMAGTDKWDGTLTVEELTPRFGTNFAGGIAAFTEDVAAATDEPTASAITETTARFAARFRTAFYGSIAEEITADPIVEQQTIEPTAEAVLEWTFQERYVYAGENGVQLRTAWRYESAETAVDSGRMTVVKAVTNDLASVEEVTVGG